jgi:glycolate oxidase FAD binding subunit
MIEQTSKPLLFNDLIAIVGPEHVSEADDALSVSPTNTEETAAVLRLANFAKVPVYTTGGGSKRGWSDCASFGILLRTTRMNALLDHTWQDMTCTIQTGCTWAAMQILLAKHGQFVALDPLWPDTSTIGGVIAVNDSGALRFKYGSLRDLVIGMTLVLADGTIAHTGGKVVKNVAGYDLHKLMIGAFGTLGLITEITFRLHSLPVAKESFTVVCQTVEPLGSLLLQLLDSHLSLHAIQLRTAGGSFHLDLELATFPQALAVQRMQFAAILKEHRLAFEAATNTIWSHRLQLFNVPDTFTVKATMMPTEIARFTAIVSDMGGSSVTQATGIMTAALPASTEQIPALRQQIIDAGGSLTILTQPATVSLDRWGPAPDALLLMQRLKQHFDPNRTLNPGCFLGGI